MRHISLALSIVSLALNIGRALGGSYDQTNSHAGRGFLDNFSFEAIRDPTNGRVNYVDAATAAKANLTYATADRFVLRSDFKKYLSSSGVGRDSVRIISNREYKTSVLVYVVAAFGFLFGSGPGLMGEIDILEGINDQAPNAVTLHTSSGTPWNAQAPLSRSGSGRGLPAMSRGMSRMALPLLTRTTG
ncbi:hypothetical protein H0H81_011000 [Sphagnurus paluster]|uniref:Uncharacterized protein n=1 Tax=Sphagnurus paluster TaxID=117069 RepID=A0A9P7KHP8_9AGAR|nr:hypothetical protein H0H81_011000 [Sphagnurus paluster]